MHSLLETALAYHRRGWSLLPVRMEEKKPACRWKSFQTARASEGDIVRWFRRGDQCGVAVIFGEISGGLASRDFDDREAYEAWARTHTGLAESLPTVKTRRGYHVYFQVDAGEVLDLRRQLNKPDNIGAIDCGDGELRAGVGCYSLLPPSRHPSGARYRWMIDMPDLPPMIDLLDSGLAP